MGTRKTRENSYVLRALENFRDYLLLDKQKSGGVQFVKRKINLQGLEKAIRAMPKEDRENIEKFWGLTGGLNHSEKMKHTDYKDIAFINLRNRAHVSLRKLSRLELVAMYFEELDSFIDMVGKKIDKKGFDELSDYECVKYLMAYFIIMENGPKMSFEEDLMVVETKIDKAFYLDEFQALFEMCQEVSKFPDKSIKIGLIITAFEMLDFCDSIAIKQNFGIKIPEDILKIFRPNEIESLQTFGPIRDFKERVFKNGAWNVTGKIILGEDVDIKEFVDKLNIICRNWSLIEEFKIGQRQVKTSKEVLTLNLYNIGGLEFTDTYEVEFLYLSLRSI